MDFLSIILEITSQDELGIPAPLIARKPPGLCLEDEDVGNHPLLALPEEKEHPTGSVYDLLEDAYSLSKPAFRKLLTSKPKLFVFHFLYCIRALMANFPMPSVLFYCYLKQTFLLHSSLNDNAFAKVAILKRVAHFEPATFFSRTGSSDS